MVYGHDQTNIYIFIYVDTCYLFYHHFTDFEIQTRYVVTMWQSTILN